MSGGAHTSPAVGLPDTSILLLLQRRGITLPGIHAHRDQEAQKLRFITAGWDTSACLDMHTIHHRCLVGVRLLVLFLEDPF